MKPRTHTDTIVIHCSATPDAMDIGAREITDWHKGNGWETIGYHYVIRRSGKREYGRPLQMVGAHVNGYNARSVGICLVGGTDENGLSQNNFTPEQFSTLRLTLKELDATYPNCRVLGHRDLSPDADGDGLVTPNEWIKECPSFDVAAWLEKDDIQ